MKGFLFRAVEKGEPPFPGAKKIFFHVKSENIKCLHVDNIWDFSLFIEEDISDKKYIAFSEFVVLGVNWVTTVTDNEFVSFCF